MGTDVAITVVGEDRLVRGALARIRQLEARWSRFQHYSEVSRLNRAAGLPVEVSADTRLLVRRAVDAWRLSAGFVDCTLLDELVAAGYDRSFEQLPLDRVAAACDGSVSRRAGPADIVIDAEAVALPRGVRFDPGGIGKGLAADIVSAELVSAGAEGVCVDVGGDVRVRGVKPNGESWTISMEHPHQASSLGRIGLAAGAVASSTTLRRQWRVGGELRHHLIDPWTGRPADSRIAFVTAVASEGWQAETMAKALLIRGGAHPFDLVDGTGMEALVVDYGGAITTSRGFDRFTGGVELPSTLAEVA